MTKIFRFQTLVSLLLSSQTKDVVTAKAIEALKANLPGGLRIESVLAASDQDLDHCIQKVGFHNRKVQYLKQTADLLQTKFDGDIPASLDGLCSLPGVGPKMAYLALQCAWGEYVS
jgi:endonuclease-3